MSTKKVNSHSDILVKYIVDTISKNPIAFIPVIQAMLDPSNPDTNKLHEMIAESVVKAVISSDKIKNICLERIVENIQQCTDKEIFKIVNDQRLQLEKDSKEFINKIQEHTTIALCEKYFEEQKKKFEVIFKDYFSNISQSIQEHVEALDTKTKEFIISKTDEHSVSINVPNHMKDDVLKYMKFLDSQT